MLQVDSANKHGILLEVVQVLTDLNLIITKAYISSDGGWFMDGDTSFPFFVLFQSNSSFEAWKIEYLQFSPPPVFNVTDPDGNKVTDEAILDYITKVSCEFLTDIISLRCKQIWLFGFISSL